MYAVWMQLAGFSSMFPCLWMLANLLARINSVSVLLQLIFPDLVEGLVLINVDPNGKGWIDWAASKVVFQGGLGIIFPG